MKNVIIPNPFLLLFGLPSFLIADGFTVWIWYSAFSDFEKAGGAGVVLVIMFSTFSIILHLLLGTHIFVVMYANQKGIIFFGLFLPIVKLKWGEVQYVALRTFKEGNVMYGQYRAVDAYKFILLSSSPLPQKRIDKIRSSRKKRLIKFSVTQKLCQVLVDHLPETKSGPFRYQLYLYKKAKK
jgi:hypothetical protein